MKNLPTLRKPQSLSLMRDPFFQEFSSLFNQFFNNFIPSKGQLVSLGRQYPKCDVIQKQKEYEIEMQIVGCNKEDIKVQYNKNTQTLFIKGQKCSQRKQSENQNTYLIRQLKKSNFSRGFQIPKQIILYDKIQPSYKDGILKVVIPKNLSKKDKVEQRQIKNFQIR